MAGAGVVRRTSELYTAGISVVHITGAELYT